MARSRALRVPPEPRGDVITRSGCIPTTALGSDWLGHPDCHGSIMLCGDFNFHAQSRLYRQLTARFHDAQTSVKGYRPRNTWFSQYPVLRLDHAFVSSDIVVHRVIVPGSYLARVASDHRPIVVDLELPAASHPSTWQKTPSH
jgi:endonuclease/exonuclease/phosphatase family metal-dependent hydrolase